MFLANAKSYNSEAYLEGLMSASSILACIDFGNYTIFEMVYGLEDIILRKVEHLNTSNIKK